MTMTKQHFELVAQVLDHRRGAAPMEGIDPAWMAGFRAAHDVLAEDFAHRFADTNPRFDRERFLRAAGVESDTPN
jgi:hypothetical protein